MQISDRSARTLSMPRSRSPSAAIGSAEIYDPATKSWSVTGRLNNGRDDHQAVSLADGTVLMLGGFKDAFLDSVELYDPATGSFTQRAPLLEPRSDHRAVLLDDGRVLVAGGQKGASGYYYPLTSTELYQPSPCIPTTCMAEGRTCGTISDRCGGTVSCGTCAGGTSCGAQNVCVAESNATYDSTRHAPVCADWAQFCDSGGLLMGRSTLGPELDVPNTIDGCRDGASGKFHSDESLDRIRISRIFPGVNLEDAAEVRVDADVWASSQYAHDVLDLYVAPNASSPIWGWVATAPAAQAGAQTLSATFKLPLGGPFQSVRGVFRRDGTADPCSQGSYDDHDDLVFRVTPIDTTPPTVYLYSPSSRWVCGSAVQLWAYASDDIGVTHLDFFVGSRFVRSLTQPPWTFTWDSTDPLINGPRTLLAVAYDASGNQGYASRLNSIPATWSWTRP